MVSDRLLPCTACTRGEPPIYGWSLTSGVDPLVVVVVRTVNGASSGHCLLFSAEIGVVYGWVVKLKGYIGIVASTTTSVRAPTSVRVPRTSKGWCPSVRLR